MSSPFAGARGAAPRTPQRTMLDGAGTLGELEQVGQANGWRQTMSASTPSECFATGNWTTALRSLCWVSGDAIALPQPEEETFR